MAQRDNTTYCRTCGNGVQGFFCSLAGTHVERIARDKVVRRLRRGDVVFREGDPAVALHCIQRGTVKVYKLGREGEEIVIRLLGPGDIMGYRPMLADEPFAASARALDDTVVCTIPRATMTAVLRESPDLALRLLGKLATELRVSEEQMVQRASEPVSQRTARFLLWLHDAQGAPHKHLRFDAVLRREDMALAIGTTPETLSRTLHDLQRRRIIDLERRSIRVREAPALRRLARDGAVEPV